MKKKILYSLASLFFMTAMVFNIQYDNEYSDIKNANIEALTISYNTANAENAPVDITCYSIVSNCAFIGCTIIRHCGAQSSSSSCQGMNADDWSSQQSCSDIQPD